MCTPIGHTLFGYSVFLASPLWNQWKAWRIFLFVLIVANMPDLDIVIGYIVGKPNLYHQHFSHSLFFVMCVSILLGWGSKWFLKGFGLKMGLLTAGILLSHLMLDFLGRDTSYPYGIQVFWPFSKEFFISPVRIVRSVSKSSASQTFIQSLFCWHNFWTVFSEIAVFVPLILGLRIWRKKRQK